MKPLNLKRPWTIVIFAVIALAFIAFQIPSFIAAQYNYMGSDDIWFGRFTHSTWIETHNIFSVIGAAIYTAGYIWSQWQGNFTAVFMFAFNPSIFDDWGMSMFAGPFIIIGMLSIGVLFFCHTIFTHYLKNRWESSLSLGLLLLIIFTQLIPTYRESYYWWAAAVNYPFYLGVLLVALSCVLRFFRAQGARRVWLYIATLLLSIFIAGGMYTFLTLLITGGLVAIFFKEVIYKNRKGRQIYLVYICFLLFAAINIFAPGNQYRLESVESIAIRNPVTAILYSFGFAATTLQTFSVTGTGVSPYTINGVNWAFLTMLVLVGIFTYHLTKNVRFRFRWVGLLGIGLFIVYASWYTPFIFGQGWTVMPRVFNGGYIVFWFFWILILAFIFGWLRPKFALYQKRHRKSFSLKMFGHSRRAVQIGVIPVLVAIFFAGYFTMNNYANGFKAIKPGALGAIQGLTDQICQWGDTGVQTAEALAEPCTNGSTERKTMAEWNEQYIAQFRRDIIGNDISDELAERCLANFWDEECQATMAASQTVKLPDTPEEDKLITAHLDMCPESHYGYNKFAEVYWNKQDVSAYYPDFQIRNGEILTGQSDTNADTSTDTDTDTDTDSADSTSSSDNTSDLAKYSLTGTYGTWGQVDYYYQKKVSDCSAPGMADLHA